MDQQLPKHLVRSVEQLNEDQLHVLHHLVADRLRLAQQARTLYAMSNYHVLDRVAFSHNGKRYEGTVTRLNQKTVTVVLDGGDRWNVAPALLTKVDAAPRKPLALDVRDE
jgi:hypothetical protein